MLQLRQQSNRFIHTFRQEHNRQPSAIEIAEHLNISVTEWQSINLAYQNRDPVSLDVSVKADQGKILL